MIFVPAPNGSKPARTLNPRTQGMLSTLTMTTFTDTLLLLLQPNRSIENEIIFSNTATIVVIAANVRNKKNNAPHILPPGIWANIFGIVMKIRLGPAPGSIPNAKQDGIMINHAISATNVSNAVILTASPVRLRSLPI
mgnify:CR=1 FL=1